MKLEAAASKAISLAKAIRDYWATELPRRHPKYPFVDPNTDSGPPPPEEKQLRRFLLRLAPETLDKLALIMNLGREGFYTSNILPNYQSLREEFRSSESLVSYMIDQAQLADYLEEGMTILKAHSIDLDKMDITTAGA